jgi:1,2-diacylglycerol 3-beta-glucosyltransferase
MLTSFLDSGFLTTAAGVVNGIAAFVVALAAAYFFIAVGLGVRHARRQRVRLDYQAELAFGAPFRRNPMRPQVARDRWHLYVLVPCLNEEAVIGRTVTGLVDPSGCSRTIVIDDGSDDRTGDVARAVGDPGTSVLTRVSPEARLGKGAALNAGFRALLEDVLARGLDPENVVVVVMDADGQLSDGAIDEVLPLFEIEGVGGVQLAVRIRNRNENFWLRFQDHQFWTLSALTQFGRVATGTVSLGGNGQFTRLSALMEVGDQPWVPGALTEDLELALALGQRGWHLLSTPRAAVDQEGVPQLGALIRQRTRWYQGHMMSARRIPDLLRSKDMSNAAAIEMMLYLLVPWILDLPWSILYHLICLQIAINLWQSDTFADPTWGLLASAAGWYLLAFWPALITAWFARRRDKTLTRRSALMLGHCFLVTNYVSYVCTWRALFRIFRGRTGWTKTERVGASRGAHRSDTSAGEILQSQ